ncbi:hypothetical protein GCM10010182_61290 [Actinomadura cremea]|nr:hypothetical protein GCM10010182_61290 [Actinomadura cremea]
MFFGILGRLRRGYQRGTKDRFGALGLGSNAITWWNQLYIDAAVKQLEAGGLGIGHNIRASLSLVFEHINFHGFSPFHRPALGQGLRALRDPNAADFESEL